MKIVLRSAFLAMLLVCMQPGSSIAAEDEVERAREYFTNLELINQDGENGSVLRRRTQGQSRRRQLYLYEL